MRITTSIVAVPKISFNTHRAWTLAFPEKFQPWRGLGVVAAHEADWEPRFSNARFGEPNSVHEWQQIKAWMSMDARFNQVARIVRSSKKLILDPGFLCAKCGNKQIFS